MKSISLWARHHRPAAILIIILSKLLLAVAAIYTGILFSRTGISFSSDWIWVCALLFLLTAFLYEQQAASYKWRTLLNFCLATFAFLASIIFSNTLDPVYPAEIATASSIRPLEGKPGAREILASLEYRDKNTLTKKEKRILKGEFKVQLKNLAVAKFTGDKERSKETLAIILTIIGALGLIALLSVLVCNLSCSGAEGAALAVFVIGLAGIIWGIAAVARHFKKKRLSRQSK